ncbi:MAG: signal peptidase I [Pseudomonadota bacterium]
MDEPRESFGEIVRTVIYALLIALVFRTVLFQPFSIPSGSMKPTLLIGDYLFVSKYSYGYSKYSLPYGNLLPEWFSGRLFGGEPERGDVIVFRNPRNENQDYIKRLVGLPGDRVQMRRGVLHINGEPVKLERIESFVEPVAARAQQCVSRANIARLRLSAEDRELIRSEGRDLCLKIQYIETLPNGTRHPVLDADGDRNLLDNTSVFIVPQGHYFFSGDNRDNSQDSRERGGIGFVPADHLIGRAELVLLSSDGPFWQFWNWRGDRFFQSID